MGIYQRQWKAYRRRWRISLGLALAIIPGILVTARIGERFRTEVPIFVIGTVWILPFLISQFWACAWPCPRCGETYIGSWWYGYSNGLLFRTCAHCGLPKYDYEK